MQQQTSSSPQKSDDLPLVSVIIRSMDRPTLSEALISVALQTYANIEVVVVAASGSAHTAIGKACGPFLLRLEIAPDGSPLTRPQAANLGLEKAKGQWIIFLDDDDLFDPDHIAGLIQALRQHPQIQAIYAGVRVEDENGHITTLFNTPYDQRRLFTSNFIPIHALLFSRCLIEKGGARFDENLDVYEDWDFWLQLSCRTSFLHSNKISAVYRAALGNSGLSLDVNKNLQLQGRELLYDKWRLLWTGKDINCFTQYLFEQECKVTDHDGQIAILNEVVTDHDGQIAMLNEAVTDRDRQIAMLNEVVTDRDRQIAMLNEVVTDRDRQIAILNEVVADHDRQIAILNEVVTDRDRQIAMLNEVVTDRDEQIAMLNEVVTDRDEQIAILNEVVVELVNSKSWLITKPLRWISRIMRGDYIVAMDPINKLLQRSSKQLIINLDAPIDGNGFVTSLPIKPTHSVTVILPVYRDIEMTKRCILAAMPNVLSLPMARMIVINDASPDRGMQEMLEQLAAQWPNVLVVLKNEKNLGFVSTVNRGFKYFPQHDAVLLNSDVIVPQDWLSRLIDEAYSRANIGTVTPFSNNATICSFPHFLQENIQPFNLDVDSIDAVFRQLKLPCIEAPTGVGFCMYIRRACLDEVGYLDEEQFGKGYGEENDLCQRALKSGWLNIISPNIYAYHEGGVSFLSEKNTLIDNAMQVLDVMHSNYHADVQNFIKHDSLKIARVTRYVQLLSTIAVPKVLHVSHALGGGIRQHIEELAQHFEQNMVHIILAPSGENGKVSVSIGISQYADKLIYRIPTEYAKLVDLLKTIGISAVHFHHTNDLVSTILDLPNDLGVPHLFTAHDFYWLNANPTLTDETGKYPGFYSETLHNPLFPLPPGMTTEDWQKQFRPLIDGAECVIFPSNSTKLLFNSVYHIKNYIIAPHVEMQLSVDRETCPFTKKDCYIIGVLGAIGREKGADLLEQIAKNARKLDLPFKFKLIGYSYRPLKKVSTTGPYETKYLANLIKKNELDIVLFTAQWPETYSYTLSHALDSGLPIIAPNIGAFPERLSGRPNTLLFNYLSPATELLNQFNIFIENMVNNILVTAPIFEGDKSKHDFYTYDYLSIVSRNLKIIDVNKAVLFEFYPRHIVYESAHNKSAWRESLLHVLWRLYMNRSTQWLGRAIPKKTRNAIRLALSNNSIHDIAQG